MLTMLGIAKQLLLPPLSLPLLGLAGLFIQRIWPVLGRTLAIASFVSLYALSTPYVADLLISQVQEPNSSDRTGQAIVVLSAGSQPHAIEYEGTTADALTLERLRYGAKLQRLSKLPILVSGGTLSENQPPIADIMSKILIEEYAIAEPWTERTSYNTTTNASRSAVLLRQRGISKIYLVTHAWHMKRARLAFEDQGLTVLAAGTGHVLNQSKIALSDVLPSIRALSKSYYALHELVGLARYALKF